MLRDIVYETEDYWIRRIEKGFEVYRIESTHSVKCATIGYRGMEGLDRAKAEIERRKAQN